VFVINALLDDADRMRIRRRLHERGILVCDLGGPADGDPAHRRWLVGTFALAHVLMTLSKENLPVLYTERAQPLEIPRQDEGDLQITRQEQLDIYGAERVCRTDTYKGSMLIAMAANEIAIAVPEVRGAESPLLDQIIARLGEQSAQWLSLN
jgi:hypothetical protein